LAIAVVTAGPVDGQVEGRVYLDDIRLARTAAARGRFGNIVGTPAKGLPLI